MCTYTTSLIYRTCSMVASVSFPVIFHNLHININIFELIFKINQKDDLHDDSSGRLPLL